MSAVLTRIVLPLVALALGVFAVMAMLDRMAADERAAERRALNERDAALTRAALVPGSPLACLTGTAGEAVEDACERAVFASPQSAAAAVAYMATRMQLLADASAHAPGEPGMRAEFAATRRAIELDRFGLAAQVLAARDGCTADNCAAFALVDRTDALRSNLKARVFDQYVARHAATWTAPVQERPAEVSLAPAMPPPDTVAQPLSEKYDFPSAASIPPVSIMNAEPPRPKEPDAPAPADAAAAAR